MTHTSQGPFQDGAQLPSMGLCIKSPPLGSALSALLPHQPSVFPGSLPNKRLHRNASQDLLREPFLGWVTGGVWGDQGRPRWQRVCGWQDSGDEALSQCGPVVAGGVLTVCRVQASRPCALVLQPQAFPSRREQWAAWYKSSLCSPSHRQGDAHVTRTPTSRSYCSVLPGWYNEMIKVPPQGIAEQNAPSIREHRRAWHAAAPRLGKALRAYISLWGDNLSHPKSAWQNCSDPGPLHPTRESPGQPGGTIGLSSCTLHPGPKALGDATRMTPMSSRHLDGPTCAFPGATTTDWVI